MFATNRTLNALDVVFNVAEVIESYDYVAVGDRVIQSVATASAIIIGVVTYIVTALQLFWCEHGEVISTRTVQFVILTADFAGACYFAGRNFRPVANRYCALLADNAFYTIAGM